MPVTDAKDIRMNIVHVLMVCGNLTLGVYLFAKRDSQIERVSDAVIRIENNQKQEAAESKLWKVKVEAEMENLKIRTALLESRVFTSKR